MNERTSYLITLIVLLFLLAAVFGVPSAGGVLFLLAGLVFAWRLGVIIRDFCNE